MAQNLYVEEVYLDFYNRVVDLWNMPPQDYRIMTDFREKIINDESLTQNQGNFLLKLMSKYRDTALTKGLDISWVLDDPKWKKDFRVIDYSKRVFVEKDSDGIVWVCLKFPYAFKDVFERETELVDREYNQWDSDRKIRRLDLYKCNLIKLQEFVIENGFEIEKSFFDAVAEAEEIWNQQDEIIPYIFSNGKDLEPVNIREEVKEFWHSNLSGSYEKDLFLSKSMSLPVKFSKLDLSDVERMAATNHTDFWIKNHNKFFDLYKSIGGVFCVLLDRNTQDLVSWLESFVKKSDFAGISRSDIKVCFRESETKSSRLNKWIKDNHVGGAVKDGKILIFLHKPPKWLFKDGIDVKIIATNSFTPIADPLAQAWVSAHYCVCYLGDIKPTKFRNKKIVEL